jgi:hypothetical protein
MTLSAVCRFFGVRPKSATTAQPKRALKIFPAERVRNANRAWMRAMSQAAFRS